jgi:hypothetical protein
MTPCTKCGNHGRKYDGRSECISCTLERSRRHYAVNGDRKREYMREYAKRKKQTP